MSVSSHQPVSSSKLQHTKFADKIVTTGMLDTTRKSVFEDIYLLVDFARASREAEPRKPACNLLLLHSIKEKGVSAVLQQSVANKIIVVVPAAVARIPYVVFPSFFLLRRAGGFRDQAHFGERATVLLTTDTKLFCVW